MRLLTGYAISIGWIAAFLALAFVARALFDWMSRCRRPPPPKEIEAKVLCETDNRFYWLEFSGVPERFTTVDFTKEKQAAIKPFPVSASKHAAL